MPLERRKESRLPLDDICYACLAQAGRVALDCVILDISPHGARVGVAFEGEGLAVGTIISLHVEKPCYNIYFNNRQGKVIWNCGLQMGLFFPDPVYIAPMTPISKNM